MFLSLVLIFSQTVQRSSHANGTKTIKKQFNGIVFYFLHEENSCHSNNAAYPVIKGVQHHSSFPG